MSVYGKRINLSFWLFPCFPVAKITYISLQSPEFKSASQVSTASCQQLTVKTCS